MTNGEYGLLDVDRLSKSGYESLPYWKVGSVDSSVQANCQTSLATGKDVAIHIGVINQLKIVTQQ